MSRSDEIRVTTSVGSYNFILTEIGGGKYRLSSVEHDTVSAVLDGGDKHYSRVFISAVNVAITLTDRIEATHVSKDNSSR